MGTSSQNTGQTQQSTTNPWAPSQPELQQLLSSIQGIGGGPTYQQQQALHALKGASTGLPNYGAAAGGVTSGLLGGDPTGLLKSSLQSYQNNVNPIASASLDPTKTPGMQNVLQTIQQDVGNSVNGMFAGSGRDGSGLNQQALARGISQGEAVPLLGQYNQNVQNVMGANQGLLGAGQGTAGAITGNQQAGMGAAAQQPGIAQAPALAQLQAAQTAYNLPLSNLGGIEGLTLPIAGLGGQSAGSGNSNTTNTPNPFAMALAGLGLGGSSIGGGLFSSGFNQLGKLFQQPTA
jgi:hypothetical protein